VSIGEFGSVLDSQTFAQVASQPPTLQKRTENVALLLTVDPAAQYPYLRSLDISDLGIIDPTPIDTLSLPNVGARDTFLLHFLEDVFALYHNDAAANSRLWTVACDDQGVITDSPLDDLAVGQASNVTRRSDLLKPHDNILLTGTSYPYPGVHLQTVAITDAGFMPDTVTDSMDLPVRPRMQRLRQGAGNWIIELASLMPSFYIHSFTCTAAGVLPASVTDSWGPIPCVIDHKSLCKISDTVFAICTRDGVSPLKIYTFSINPDGTINKSWIDSEQVEASPSAHVEMTEMGGGYFVLAYNMVAPIWRLKTYFIAADGKIQDGEIDSLDMASPNRGNPWWEHLNGNIWTLTYEDVAQSVRVDTIEIDTISPNTAHTELTVGIGP